MLVLGRIDVGEVAGEEIAHDELGLFRGDYLADLAEGAVVAVVPVAGCLDVDLIEHAVDVAVHTGPACWAAGGDEGGCVAAFLEGVDELRGDAARERVLVEHG